MEAGDPGAPMDLAAKLVVEEQKAKLDPVTVHSRNMVAKPAQAHPHWVLAATQVPVQLMEAGDPGAPMERAVVHVMTVKFDFNVGLFSTTFDFWSFYPLKWALNTNSFFLWHSVYMDVDYLSLCTQWIQGLEWVSLRHGNRSWMCQNNFKWVSDNYHGVLAACFFSYWLILTKTKTKKYEI